VIGIDVPSCSQITVSLEGAINAVVGFGAGAFGFVIAFALAAMREKCAEENMHKPAKYTNLRNVNISA
jgi:hypothetical protein